MNTNTPRDLKVITERIVSFRDARDWKQFHGLKDIALSLMLEAGEVGEIFQFKSDEEISLHLHTLRERIGDELSDVLYWTLLMAHDSGVDLEEAFSRKMARNEAKYPLEKAKGSKKKYTEL
jgi:NTP pyrophosphatase (non-canonical NTP hydrolase)